MDFLRIGTRVYNLDRVGFIGWNPEGSYIEHDDEPPTRVEEDTLMIVIDGEEYWLDGDDARQAWLVICGMVRHGDRETSSADRC
jgi:hypothetical protein